VKNHIGLVRAFAQVLRRDPARAQMLRLVIAGEGSERARIEAVLKDEGIHHLAWLPGERQDVPTILRGLDLFVLPSVGEGVSNTILEAMATGLPVLATDVGANGELVVDGVTGSIVPARDLEALGDAIARYSADVSLSRTQGRAGRLRVEQRFSLERMVERYHDVYLASIKGSTSSRDRPKTLTRHVPH
jgi:glycosyltransferase involved in cell wall biosynthesis